MSKYDVARWDELDGVVKKVRRALGVTAFGVNYFDLPPGAEGLEHNETQTNQEEVYVYVRGSGLLRIDGAGDRGRRGHGRAGRPRGDAPAGRRRRGTAVGGDRRAARRQVRTALVGLGSRHAHDRTDRRGAADPPCRHCARTWTTSGTTRPTSCARSRRCSRSCPRPRHRRVLAPPRPLEPRRLEDDDRGAAALPARRVGRRLRGCAGPALQGVDLGRGRRERWGAVYLWESREDAPSRSCRAGRAS